LGVSRFVNRTETAHFQELVQAITVVQDGAGGSWQRIAAALAIAFPGWVGDAAGRVGAKVRRPFGLGGGTVRLQEEAAIHAGNGAGEQLVAAGRTDLT